LRARGSGGGADAIADEYIDAVVAGAIERLQQELLVFGRIDDDRPWRVGLFGVDEGGDQLVVDWRAPFATAFYQARFQDPRGLTRRVSYVGCIDDLLIEDFVTGEVDGVSPLFASLSSERGTTMRAAVATLQSEQDELVRLDPRARLVLRGGPGTGKTVVGLHRAAWLVYNDQRLTADRILVLGPSERYLRFVATVLPSLGEARVVQTTFDRLLGPSWPGGSDERWIQVLDDLEASMLRPAPILLRGVTVPEAEVAELVERFRSRALPWRDRRKLFLTSIASRCATTSTEAAKATAGVWPACTLRSAWAKVRNRRVLTQLGVDQDLIDAWLASDGDGALHDEVRARFEGVPARYSHVIVDEAQDLSLLQLRAVTRRSDGVTLVGDDAQRSNPAGIGLHRAAALVEGQVAEIATAYRMSAEIADWLNEHAKAHAIEAVQLIGIRPTGRAVREASSVDGAHAELSSRWSTVAVIRADEVWDHKGVEYDAVVLDAVGMTPAEVYLGASRAAHELVVVR
jgi:DNA helicase IV